jgi:hypothetical protein
MQNAARSQHDVTLAFQFITNLMKSRVVRRCVCGEQASHVGEDHCSRAIPPRVNLIPDKIAEHFQRVQRPTQPLQKASSGFFGRDRR